MCSQDRSYEREERGFVFILHQESMHAFFTVVKDPSSNVRSTVGVSIYLSSANASVIGGGKGPFLPPKSANCMHGHSHQKKKKEGTNQMNNGMVLLDEYPRIYLVIGERESVEIQSYRPSAQRCLLWRLLS